MKIVLKQTELELRALCSSISFHVPKRRVRKAHTSSAPSCNFTRRHCFIFTVTPCTPTITAFLRSHQTLPIVLGVQLLYFKVLLTPPSSSASSFVFPTIHFVLLPVFSGRTFRLLSDMQKMLTLIRCSSTKRCSFLCFQIQ